MKTLFIPIIALMILSITACTQAPTKVAEKDTGTPNWTTSTPPTDTTNIYAVASFPITNDNIEAANHAAMQLAKSNIQKQFDDLLNNYIHQATQNINRSALETKIRHATKSQMHHSFTPETQLISSYTDTENQQLYVFISANKSLNQAKLQKQLNTLDSQLLDYLHASQKGGNFEQLLSLLPSLPTLEERALVLAKIALLHNENATLLPDSTDSTDSTLADQMNSQITMLFNNMIIGVNALTADTEKLEPEFIKALNHAGLSISVRFADLTLRYYLEPHIEHAQDGMVNLSLISDIEILTRSINPFPAFNLETQAISKTASEAKLEALQPVANKITATIVDHILIRINDVNRINHNR